MQKFIRAQAAALAALLVSCGGGSLGTSGSTAPSALAAVGSSAAAAVDSANVLMDWAEAQAPFQGYFPEHQASLLDVPPFLYRRYSSGVYLGVVTSDGAGYPLGGVYVLGGVFGGAPTYVGQVSAFAATPPAPGPSAAASCPAFASGTYRMIKPAPAGQQTLVTLAAVVMDSAGTPSIALPGGPARAMTVGHSPCSFTLPDGSALAVSPASVALMASLEGTDRYPALLFPEQSVALADLAGTWNRLSWNRRDPGGFAQPYQLVYGTLTLNTSGVLTSGQECSVAADLSGGCQSGAGNAALVVSSEGGYAGTGDMDGSRIFVYRKGTDMMAMGVDPDGSLNVLTPQAAASLPTAGSSSTVLNMSANTAGVLGVADTNAIPAFSTNVNTITSVDTPTGVVVRSSTQDGGAPTTQTLHYNTPLAGFRKRDGGTGVSAAIFLPLHGMGVTATSRLGAVAATTPGTGNGYFNLSADQP